MLIKKFEEFVNEGIIMKTIKRSLGNGVRKEDDPTIFIKEFMDKLNITNYTINPDKSVDVVIKYVALESEMIVDGKLPIKFGKVDGDFDCSFCELNTLENAPYEVTGTFRCAYNNLVSLEGGPKKVGSNYICRNNDLTSLEGCAEEIGGSFYCGSNYLTSLKGGPKKVGGSFNCSNNQLTSLEGCPKIIIYKDFSCSKNRLKSLEGCPEEVRGNFHCIEFSEKEIRKYCNVKGCINML